MIGNGVKDDFDSFTEIVAKWQETYNHAVYSYIALNERGQKRLLSGRIELHTDLANVNRSALNLERPHLTARRFVVALGPESVSEILAKAKQGLMGDNGTEIPLFRERELQSPYWQRLRPVPSSLVTRGSVVARAGAVEQEVFWELTSGPIPYGSLDELCTDAGLPPWRFGIDESRIEILANAPARIQNGPNIENGKCDIQIQIAEGLQTEKLRLGIQVFYANHTQRTSIMGDELPWGKKDGNQTAVHTISTGDALRLQAYLSYDGTPLEERSMSDPKALLNPRCAVHHALDANLAGLTRVLLNPENDARAFQAAATVLLNLLGFAGANYDHLPSLEDGPDVIALTPRGSVAVVECTLRHVDNKAKLSKLAARATLVEKELLKAGHVNAEVQPILITSYKRDLVKDDITTAVSRGILVLCHEDLESLLKQAVLCAEPDQLFARWRTMLAANRLGFR